MGRRSHPGRSALVRRPLPRWAEPSGYRWDTTRRMLVIRRRGIECIYPWLLSCWPFGTSPSCSRRARWVAGQGQGEKTGPPSGNGYGCLDGRTASELEGARWARGTSHMTSSMRRRAGWPMSWMPVGCSVRLGSLAPLLGLGGRRSLTAAERPCLAQSLEDQLADG